MTFLHSTQLRRSISGHLASFEPLSIQDANLRHAAVAIVVVSQPGSDIACVLLTLRAAHLSRHSNQYALPGGKLDAGETVQEAALRELREELNITLSEQDILGVLDEYPTRSGFSITPVVMWAGLKTDIEPDPGEVAQVFHIPLGELNSPAIPHLSAPGPDGIQVMSAPLPVLGHDVFAPTAALLYQFREVALNARTTRVAHFGQPEFAWK